MKMILVITLTFFASFVAAATTSTTVPPKVVFIGDFITYLWSNAFAANPNWINKGVDGMAYFGQGTASETANRFESDVVSLHPAIVHIMVGGVDAQLAHDADWRIVIANVLASLDGMVKEAETANIKVILGTTASSDGIGYQPLSQINGIIASYGAAHSIPVINYADALCSCVESVGGSGTGYDFLTQQSLLVPSALPSPDQDGLIPSPQGYSLMTKMAQSVISTMNLTLKSGWLQNVEQANANEDDGPTANVNSVYGNAIVQFIPIGVYSDGSQRPLLNSTFLGASGTWTSDNPLVMSVSQTGLAWALTTGTATIRYTPPNGVRFSSWVMHVDAD